MKRACFFAVTATVALLGFAAPASATHVACGDTITVNTRLDSDVECPGTADYGLLIGADNVRLHLGHFAIRSPDPGGIVGVAHADAGTTYSGVQIRGGTIVGFSSGVFVETNDSSALGLTVTSGSGIGIQLRGNRNSIYLNTITTTEETVGDGGGGGIEITGTDAYVAFNTVRGIGSGMIAVGGNNSRVAANKVECAPGSGDGIVVDFYIDTAVVALNTVTGCESIGIAVVPESPEFVGGAQVRRNVTNGNGEGIDMADATGLLWRNTANNNTSRGIVNSQAGGTVTQNTANNNGAFGIEGVEGTIDGGGNTASGNGIEDCINVSCSPPPP